MEMKARLGVTEADPSGNCATVYETNSPYLALSELNRLRVVAPKIGKANRAYGVHDIDNPERGDVQDWLEEVVFNDPHEALLWDLAESCRILASAKHAALDEIVERGLRKGLAIARNEDPDAIGSLHDAINAYYVARRAHEIVGKEYYSA
jgi:hypothetical protein